MLQITYSFEATFKKKQCFLEKGLKSPQCLTGRIATKLFLTRCLQYKQTSVDLGIQVRATKGCALNGTPLQTQNPRSCISCFFTDLSEGWKEQLELVFHHKAQFC